MVHEILRRTALRSSLSGVLIQVKSILAFLDAPPVHARLSGLPFMVRYLKADRRRWRFNRAPPAFSD